MKLEGSVMKLLKRVLKWITAAVVVLLVIAFLVGFIAYWRTGANVTDADAFRCLRV